MFPIKYVLYVLVGLLVLGAYGLGVVAVSRPIPSDVLHPEALGQSATAAAESYLYQIALDNQIAIKHLACTPDGESGAKTFVKCQVQYDTGHTTMEVSLLRTIWQGLDYQVQ